MRRPDAYKSTVAVVARVRSLMRGPTSRRAWRLALCRPCLGAHAEMTAVYLNDRGLTEAEWKAVEAMPA